MPEYVDVIARGIPCLARIDRQIYVKPWRGDPRECPSDLDYYGYSELEYILCDRNGREASWIDAKMTDKDWEDVETQVREELFRSRD